MLRAPGQVGGANDLIVLNVGGQTFITRKSTLYRVQHSRLYMVACGDYSAATGIIRLSPADIAGSGAATGAGAAPGAAGATAGAAAGLSGGGTLGSARPTRGQNQNPNITSFESSTCCPCRCHYPGSMSVLASPDSAGFGSVAISPPAIASPQGPGPGPGSGGGSGAGLASTSNQSLSRIPVPGPSHQSSVRSTSLEEEALRTSAPQVPNVPAVPVVQQALQMVTAPSGAASNGQNPTTQSPANNLKLPNEIIYFDRDADIFRHVLDYYRNGELHLPQSACGPMARKELIFWGASHKTPIVVQMSLFE